MQLCTKLVRAKDPDEVHPVATQLQRAIHERVERVRENAVEVAVVDRLVDLQGATALQPWEDRSN